MLKIENIHQDKVTGAETLSVIESLSPTMRMQDVCGSLLYSDSETIKRNINQGLKNISLEVNGLMRLVF